MAGYNFMNTVFSFADIGSFQKKFSDFDALRKEFEHRYENLHQAVAFAVRDYCEDFVALNPSFNRNESIQKLFEEIDIKGYARKKLRSAQREKSDSQTASAYLDLINRWAKHPTANRRIKDETEPLIVFYYFAHHVLDENNKYRERFWHMVLRELRAKSIEPAVITSPMMTPTASRPGLSPTEILMGIIDRLTAERDLEKFVLRLDWSEQEGAFVFDPNTPMNRDDEALLDRLLYYLSLAGGILRRGEIGLVDANILRSHVKITMGNAHVQNYLVWLQRPDQIPDHSSYLDAVFLAENLAGIHSQKLIQYRNHAESVLGVKG